jgi:hypothetical protein
MTADQKSIARAMRAVLEDNFYFATVAENCIHGDLSAQEPILLNRVGRKKYFKMENYKFINICF